MAARRASTTPEAQFRPQETLNWLMHLHYIRGEFDRLEQLTGAEPAPSDYALYLRGLVQLREQSDVKGALRSFSSIQSTSEPLYCKAVARCLMLLGECTAPGRRTNGLPTDPL